MKIENCLNFKGSILLIILIFNGCQKIDEVTDIEEVPIYALMAYRESDAFAKEWMVSGNSTVYYGEGVGTRKFKKKGIMSQSDIDSLYTYYYTSSKNDRIGLGCYRQAHADGFIYSIRKYTESNTKPDFEVFPCENEPPDVGIKKIFKSYTE